MHVLGTPMSVHISGSDERPIVQKLPLLGFSLAALAKFIADPFIFGSNLKG